jgi:hypothetical protein
MSDPRNSECRFLQGISQQVCHTEDSNPREEFRVTLRSNSLRTRGNGRGFEVDSSEILAADDTTLLTSTAPNRSFRRANAG